MVDSVNIPTSCAPFADQVSCPEVDSQTLPVAVAVAVAVDQQLPALKTSTFSWIGRRVTWFLGGVLKFIASCGYESHLSDNPAVGRLAPLQHQGGRRRGGDHVAGAGAATLRNGPVTTVRACHYTETETASVAQLGSRRVTHSPGLQLPISGVAN